MFNFTFKFNLTFTYRFLLEIITWVPYMLGSCNLVCYYPDLNLQLSVRVAPGSCSWVRLRVQRAEAFYTLDTCLVSGCFGIPHNR